MVIYGVIRYIYYDIWYFYGVIRYYRYKVERRGLKYQKFLYHCGLPVFLFYRRLTILLFKGKIEVNKIKIFYSMKTCLDLNNTIDSDIYYLEDNLK